MAKDKLYTKDEMKKAWFNGWSTCEDVQCTDFDEHYENWIIENLK
jgi:hypothetical protein